METKLCAKLTWLAVEGENTRLRHYLARLKRKTLCYSKSDSKLLRYSIKLLLHYLTFNDVPLPSSINYFDRALLTARDRETIPQFSNAISEIIPV
jgi:hypothetical protein